MADYVSVFTCKNKVSLMLQASDGTVMALGEKLGVSRQSIYKWESDSALPEVEKLVALSGLFGVSVGWLLGTEEEPTAPEELTEAQLKMVEEIVGRYLAAQPSGKAVPLREAAEPEEDYSDYDEPEDYDDAPPWDVDDEENEGGDE